MVVLSYCLCVCSAGLALAASILTTIRLIPILFPVRCNTFSTPSRPPQPYGDAPFVTIQVPIHNEPPALVIETLRSLTSLDYPNYEIIVFDNNTKDPSLWEPVEEFCRTRPDRITFLHRNGICGFKAGALNYLATYVNSQAQLIAVVDADYTVEANFLRDLVPYFDNPNVAIVQTPQGYRDVPSSLFSEWAYCAYMLFLRIYAPFCSEVMAAPFLGSMGLVRRSVLEQAGYWNALCLTEDMELSQRIIAKGYDSIFVPRQYGRGLMPFNYKDYRVQRFRWSAGNTQALRQFIVSLCLRKVRANSRSCRHLLALCVWFHPAFLPSLALLLVIMCARFIPCSASEVRTVLRLGALLCSVPPLLMVIDASAGYLLSKAMANEFRLRTRLGAIISQLSLFYEVASASVKAIFKNSGVFLRTPKTAHSFTACDAVRCTKEELAIAAVFSASLAVEIIVGEGDVSIILVHT
jgi:cellulose synthase/poly-beta-1,6-N-acetylglucosamine synthase-like glycosyltransferase